MTVTTAAETDWHGKPPDSHRYYCHDCNVGMSTTNLVLDLAVSWRERHAGHNVEEAHEAHHYEPCTGVAATYCPNCGDCSCPVEIVNGQAEVHFDDLRADPRCPLHGLASTHG